MYSVTWGTYFEGEGRKDLLYIRFWSKNNSVNFLHCWYLRFQLGTKRNLGFKCISAADTENVLCITLMYIVVLAPRVY